MEQEKKYENPHNAPYFESFQKCIVKNHARGGDYEVVLRYLIQRDEILAELGVPNDDNLSGFLERNKYNTFFHDQIFERFDPEFKSASCLP